MTDVLVTGGSLFVSAAIVRRFQQSGAEVTVLNRGSRTVHGVRQLVADRNDGDAVEAALSGSRFDIVVDATCYQPEQARVLLAALGGRSGRLVMISSASVYVDRPAVPALEDASVGGAAVWGDYGRDKARSEAVYLQAAGAFDRLAVLRPPYIFGPNNSAERETWFWSRFGADLPVVIPGDGRTQVQFVHEDDLARAVDIVGSEGAGARIYNVSDPAVWTLSQLSAELAAIAGRPDTQVVAGSRAADLAPRSWFPFRDYPCIVDPARLMQETAWSPAAGLEARFAETFRQRLERGPIASPTPSATERVLWDRLALLAG